MKNVITCVENFNAFGSFLGHFVEIWTSRYIQIKRSQQWTFNDCLFQSIFKYLKKIILKLEYHFKNSYDSKRCCTIKLWKDVITLTLGSRLKQGLARVRDKREAKEAHIILPGVQESVRE